MDQKRNLIIVSFDYPPSTGGVARLCHEIAVGLQKYYESVKVLTVNVQGLSTLHGTSQEVEILKVSSKRGSSELETFKILHALKDKDSYDVICGLWHPEGLIARLAGMKHLFILGHGAEFLPGDSRLRKYIWLPLYGSRILKGAKRVLANSSYTKGLVKSIAAKARVDALPLGVNPLFFRPSQEEKASSSIFKFCTVSRILDFKGHDFILKTFENLPAALRSRIEWHIAGTGAHEQRLKDLIEESVIKNQVILHGFVPDLQLPAFYRENDVFILATRAQAQSKQVEGFGLVFLEAQSSGVPVIGTRTGGIVDAIDEGNGGWLFEQDDTASLTTIVESLLLNPQLIKEQSVKARERVLAHCTWEIYCEKLYNLLSA